MNQYLPPSRVLQIMRDALTQNEIEDWSLVSEFWDSPELIKWFHSRGYALYDRMKLETGSPSPWTIPSIPFADIEEGSYPYAYHNGELSMNEVPLRATDFTGRMIYAQNAQLRHVAIKLILYDSDESRILRFLHDKGLETLQENCIVPILDLLPFHEFCFAVMPRWAIRVADDENRPMREVLHLMHSMLKALTFLHAHNIIHRDIKMGNVLINYFADDGTGELHPARAKLLRQGKLSYALMDFDISILAPPEVKREDYRLHYRYSYDGSFNRPYDTRQGEFDYDPFAFDVGTLGVEFCYYYQYYSRDLHMLAPLLDKMTTWDIKNRFTAAEALRFFEEMRSDLTEAQLSLIQYPYPDTDFARHDEYDRWRGLPEEFQRKWAAYRQPPLPLTMKVLRKIYYTQYFPPYFIPSIRLFFFRLTCIPRSIWARFVGLRGKLRSVFYT